MEGAEMKGERKARERIALSQDCTNWDRRQGLCRSQRIRDCVCLIAAREHLKLAKPVRRVERKP